MIMDTAKELEIKNKVKEIKTCDDALTIFDDFERSVTNDQCDPNNVGVLKFSFYNNQDMTNLTYEITYNIGIAHEILDHLMPVLKVETLEKREYAKKELMELISSL